MSEESTTPDLVDVFRRVDEAMNRNDIDEVMSFFAADAVFEPAEILGALEGAAAIRAFFGDWARTWAEINFETLEIRELRSGVTFCVVKQRARPRGGEGQLTFFYGAVTTWTGRLIGRQTTYRDIDQGSCCRRTPRTGTGLGNG